MRLARLRLKNFKSFKQATLPFANGFTAIAGANGSGKSNIMDALLFVLGETSLKSLRASRLTDLVLTGSPDGYAVVNLTLEGKERNYEISRTVDKHGKSVYRMDEKRVTLGEVQNLLGELGLRVDGHNLVGQGDLLRVIDMNDYQRREMIDEIAGLQEFEEKKNEALKDLDKVERKIKDVAIVLNERMAIIQQLAREREVAQRFTALEDELKKSKATILHLEEKELSARLQVLVESQVELIGKKETARESQMKSLSEVKQLEEAFSGLDKQVIGIKTQAFAGDERSVEKVEADIRVNEERISQCKKRLEELAHQRVEWQLDLTEWERLSQKYPAIDEEKRKIGNEMGQLEKGIVERGGMAYAHLHSIQELKKAKSNCPVCARELSAKIKTKLLAEKETLHQEAQTQTNALKLERDRLRKKWEEVQGEAVLLTQLAKSDEKVKQLNTDEQRVEKALKGWVRITPQLEKERDAAAKRQASFVKENEALLGKRDKIGERLHSEREKERAFQEKVIRLDAQLSEIKIEQSKFDTRLQDVKEEMRNYQGIPPLEGGDGPTLKKRVPVIEHEMRQLGTVNLKSLEDFGHYEKEVMEIKRRSDTLDEERMAVLDLIQGIETNRTAAFMMCFDAINAHFNRLYESFFDGTARLSLSNPEKPLESGLLIEAMHGEDKRMKAIDSMSGGEKSLTSLAFIFAIQLYEPAPFYFFDEVDAALDMTNSKKVGHLIKEMSKASQFIAITHNDAVVKVADQILGVAKRNTASTVIGLKSAAEARTLEA
ncbi:MAG: AAA family ATPase [Candidatus Diapherotrites archaeon]|nr:AAA family ATPase [Candidatus Diapherotrites archaeon]MDZ4256692.1 AAA family ATPase [archaeon]